MATGAKICFEGTVKETNFNLQVRKLWKVLAKSDLLTSASYDFKNPNICKVAKIPCSNSNFQKCLNIQVH